ncbi:hypothetical protein SAMN05421878_102102 [Actinobaculum suis]|uniref:Uncharacterized protein n=1 Tax=Actinobaculum suis TaxID=1657 RepID=A0A1G7A9D8_9ACTO|nr:hypothetical protein [Actinobaculum suis]MDY5152667.1 hypothetical protein [Actinobaculum suis]SDE10506.1 hypothetical protein SAMN05421878_102102 [Actinobaculum suis]VDG75384.1 Uncharacterised protein [Actinobaculum suis]
MYGWIWRHLPGPTWFKVIEVIIILAAIIYGLFEHLFPYLNELIRPIDTTISPDMQ